MNFDNYVSTKQDKLFEANLLNDWNNGVKNQVNIGASYTLFKYLIFTPSLNYNEKWYLLISFSRQNRRNYREVELERQQSIQSTVMYAEYEGKKINMIRHVLQPSVSFSFSPKMEKPWPHFGQEYYGTYTRKFLDGTIDTTQYGYFSSNYYGGPTSNGGGVINLGLSNNLEMKVASEKDTTGYKKISLIDNFSLNTSYKLFSEEDEAPWSDLSTSLRLKITKKVNLNVNAGFCPYTYKIDKDQCKDILQLYIQQ